MVRVILVVGGTGDLGGRVVRLLRQRGEDVRCLVRAGSDGSALAALGVEVVPGDLTDPDSLRRACEGVDVVVTTATAIGRVLAGARRPSIREVDELGTGALVAAAEDAGVGRFVYTSYAGVDAGLGTSLERAKAATEARLAASALRSVVVRPDAFQEVHLGPTARFDVAAGTAVVVGRGDERQRWIATQDVAALLAALAVEAEPPGLVTVGGPEALSKNEAVAVVEAVTGRRMKVRHVPRRVAQLAVRLLRTRSDALASVLGAGLLQDRAAGGWDDAPLRARGIEPTAVTAFLRQQAQG